MPELAEAYKRELPAMPVAQRAELEGGLKVHMSELDGYAVPQYFASENEAREKEAVALDAKSPLVSIEALDMTPVEMHSQIPPRRVPAEIHSHTSPPIAVQEEMYMAPLNTHTFGTVISADGTETLEELARLAEEEQMLDREIAETERLRELLSRRTAVQQQIARGRTSRG